MARVCGNTFGNPLLQCQASGIPSGSSGHLYAELTTLIRLSRAFFACSRGVGHSQEAALEGLESPHKWGVADAAPEAGTKVFRTSGDRGMLEDMQRRPKPELQALDTAWATLAPAEREEARRLLWRYLELVRRIYRRRKLARPESPRTLV